LRSLVSTVDLEWLSQDSCAGVLSVEEVFSHLSEFEAHMEQCLGIIESGGKVPFFDQYSLTQERPHWVVTPTQLMDQFAITRRKNLTTVENVDDDELMREFEHDEFGTVTFKSFLANWVASDLEHTRLIVKLLMRQFHREVGPWERFYTHLDFSET